MKKMFFTVLSLMIIIFASVTLTNEISGDKHNALYDAKVIREIYQIVNNVTF